MTSRRRGNGEGTIYQRNDGRWEGALTMANGHRRSFYAATRREVQARRIRFDLPMNKAPAGDTKADENRRVKYARARWRALGLCIKAKLESIASGIETLDEAFLAHVVLDDGHTTG